jgi:hypothetical protein
MRFHAMPVFSAYGVSLGRPGCVCEYGRSFRAVGFRSVLAHDSSCLPNRAVIMCSKCLSRDAPIAVIGDKFAQFGESIGPNRK